MYDRNRTKTQPPSPDVVERLRREHEAQDAEEQRRTEEQLANARAWFDQLDAQRQQQEAACLAKLEQERKATAEQQEADAKAQAREGYLKRGGDPDAFEALWKEQKSRAAMEAENEARRVQAGWTRKVF